MDSPTIPRSESPPPATSHSKEILLNIEMKYFWTFKRNTSEFTVCERVFGQCKKLKECLLIISLIWFSTLQNIVYFDFLNGATFHSFSRFADVKVLSVEMVIMIMTRRWWWRLAEFKLLSVCGVSNDDAYHDDDDICIIMKCVCVFVTKNDHFLKRPVYLFVCL